MWAFPSPPRAAAPLPGLPKVLPGPLAPLVRGGLGAAILWAAATLASSRSSRMIGSRVVLAWIMIIVIGEPRKRTTPAR